MYVFVVLLEGTDNYVNAVYFGAGKIMSNKAPHVWVSLRRDEKENACGMYLRVPDALSDGHVLFSYR